MPTRATKRRRAFTGLTVTLATAVWGIASGSGVSWAIPGRQTAPFAPEQGQDSAGRAADQYLLKHPTAIHKGDDDVLTRSGVLSGTRHMKYVVYERTYRGLPVIGGDVVVTVAPGSTVTEVSVAQKHPLINTATRPQRSAHDAVLTARSDNAYGPVSGTSTPRLVILAWTGSPVLAWEVIVTEQMNAIPVEQQVYVDDKTNNIIATSEGGIPAGHYFSARSPVSSGATDRYRTAVGTGNGYYNGTVKIDTGITGNTFRMVDPTRPGLSCADPNGQVYTSRVNTWANGRGDDLVTACVDLMYGAQHEWDMLERWFGRNGFDGYGHATPMQVGLEDQNAMWFPRLTKYGKITTATGTRHLTAIDIVAHEFGHAVFEYTPGSSGSSSDFENSFINEEVADIFSALTEAYTNNPKDPPDYTMGETVASADHNPMRIMYQPSLNAGFADCYPAKRTTDGREIPGFGGHWFYLLAEGSNPSGGKPKSPTCNASTITGIGIHAAGEILYNALLTKTSTWQYSDLRAATLAAAKNLHPGDCATYNTVRGAWDAVTVPARPDEPTCRSHQ